MHHGDINSVLLRRPYTHGLQMVEGILEIIMQLVSKNQQQPIPTTASSNYKTSRVQQMFETRRYF